MGSLKRHDPERIWCSLAEASAAFHVRRRVITAMSTRAVAIIAWLFLGLSGCEPTANSGTIDSEFRMAAGQGNLAKVQALIEGGADVNSRGPGGGDAPPGGTALFLAATLNHIDVVRLLLTHGADVNLADEGGATALIYTVSAGHAAVVATLLEAGADPNAATRDGRTSLTVARSASRTDLVALLTEHGATR